MEEDNEDLIEAANYIKRELEIYFFNKPQMYRILKKIKVADCVDKVCVMIPDEIYNISYVTDRMLIKKCVQKGIQKYMEDNGLMGSVY